AILVRALRDGDRPAAAELNTPSPPSGERVRGLSAKAVPTPSPPPASGGAAAMPAVAEPAAEPREQSAPVTQFDAMPQNFGEVIALFDQRREALIRSHLWSHVHLVAFGPGRIEFRPQEAAPRDLANRLAPLL